MSFAPSPHVCPFRWRVALCLLVTLGVLLFQHLSGVWSADIGGDPDEPAHAVTSLMVRDYLTSGLGTSPLAFAQRYYDAFPKVALGHYPPGYYALTGVALLLAPVPKTLFVLQAGLIGLLAAQVLAFGWRFLRPLFALVAALLVVLMPVTLKLSQLVMADLLLAVFCMAALEVWRRFLEEPNAIRALSFGVLASLAILTKGSGLALALVPAVSLLLTCRWELLKAWVFWLAGVPVLVLAAPWMLYSSKITREGMVDASLPAYAWEGLSYYSQVALANFGLGLVACGVFGAGWLGVQAFRQRRVDPGLASLAGLLVGTVLIMLLIPTGYSSRYFMPVLPAFALFVVWPLEQRLPRAWLEWVTALLLTFGLIKAVERVDRKNVQGYGEAVAHAWTLPSSTSRQWLVSSDARGEGAMIAAAAFSTPQRAPAELDVIRASKELSSSDWLGRGYQSAVATTAEVLAFLDSQQVSCVLADQFQAESWQRPHDRLLREALRHASDRWKLSREQPVHRGQETGVLEIYQRVSAP